MHAGIEIEPLVPVSVSVSYSNNLEVDTNTTAYAVHFADAGIEVVEAKTTSPDENIDGISEFTFEQTSFSVTGTMLSSNNVNLNGKTCLITHDSTVNGTTYRYMLTGTGTSLRAEKSDTMTYVGSEQVMWKFTYAYNSNGNNYYYIQNEKTGNYLTLDAANNMIVSSTLTPIIVSAGNGNKQFKLGTNNSNLGWSGGFVTKSGTNNTNNLYLYEVTSNSVDPASSANGIRVENGDALKAWAASLSGGERIPLKDYGKTAQVKDNGYDDRMYQIDITAQSVIRDFYYDVDLGFVLDASGSMKFPGKLKEVKDVNNQPIAMSITDTNLNTLTGDKYYIISDPTGTSTVYELRRNGSTWQYKDASAADTSLTAVSGNPRFNEPSSGSVYTIYEDGHDASTDGDRKRRVDYLNDSMEQAISVLKTIVAHTESAAGDTSADMRIAWNTFARELIGTSKDGRTSYFQTLKDAGEDYTVKIEDETILGGTRQDYGLFNAQQWDFKNNSKKYVVLITDGASVKPNLVYNYNYDGKKADWGNYSVEQIRSNVETQATNLKNGADGRANTGDDVTLITVGLSTKNVVGGSNLLENIASSVGGVHQFYEAENADELEVILLNIIQSLMTQATTTGNITDTIDDAFYPVDSSGNPISEGVYSDVYGEDIADISRIGEYVNADGTAKVTTPFCVWKKAGDNWTVTWYNQEIGRDDWENSSWDAAGPWNGTIYVKAKEDYLGGNLIETNESASITATSFTLRDENYRNPVNHDIKDVSVPLAVPRVNVHNLETKGNSTTFTIYRGTSVTPADQIRALWNNIPIEEVVSATDGGNHKVTTGISANVGTNGNGETFKLADLLTELGITFSIDTLINHLGSGANATVSSDPIIYNAYGHESGTITVTLKREVGTAAVTQHNADTLGTPAEKYSLTVTYQPYTESVREEKILANRESGYEDNTNHYNGNGTRGTEETGTIKSENTHTINVFQKCIKVTKVDKTNTSTTLPGAVFELFQVDSAGQANVSAYALPSGTYSKVAGDLTADQNGVITINPIIPDKDTGVTDKTLYQPNIAVGATGSTSHDTVFYLVEKTPPTKDGVTYARMPGAIKFTMTLNESKGTESTAALYDWTQTAQVAAEDFRNGSNAYLVKDSANTTTGTNADTSAYKIKNGKPTDITLVKVDKNTQRSIGGAKFCLLRGSENVDLTQLTITTIVGGSTVNPEDYDLNGTIIKVVTVPEGGLRIAGLVDDTYTLREVAAPAGYISTDSGKTFKTENGAIKNADDTAHSNEATDIAFEVENEPGAALPSTGGPGTKIISLFGAMLTGVAGLGLVVSKRRKVA